MWHLFQTVSIAGWDCFKISSQPDSPSLMKAMRTLYGPNIPQKPSPDTEMAVDQPAVEEAPFTTVTNKKSKGKGKAPPSTNPSTPSQNVPTPALVVSRAPPLPPPVKMATIKPTPAKVATKPQVPKQAPKSFAQAAHNGNPQSTPRFAPASAHPEYESLLHLRDMFPNLPMEKVLAMYQSGFGASTSPNRGGVVHSGTSKAPKMTTHGPTRCQVLILLNTLTAEVVVANAATAVESCNRGLVEAHSKLRVESVHKVWDGISMSTNFVASAAELDVIKQWLKKVAGLAASTVVESHLPWSKSFLKILGVSYWGNNSLLPITQAQVESVIANTSIFEGVVLASHPHIIKASPSSDMSVIWIDIWDSQKGSKGKTLINRSFNFGHYTATVRGTAMHSGVAQCRNCWYWGHLTYACRAQGTKCQKCGGPHRVENYRSMCQMCSRQSLSNMLVIDYVVGHLTCCVILCGLEVGTLSLTVVHR